MSKVGSEPSRSPPKVLRQCFKTHDITGKKHNVEEGPRSLDDVAAVQNGVEGRNDEERMSPTMMKKGMLRGKWSRDGLSGNQWVSELMMTGN